MMKKMSMLSQLAGKQEQILQTLGPNNPLVTLQQYANTLTRTIEMAGFKDASNFVYPTSTGLCHHNNRKAHRLKKCLAQAEMQKAQVSAQKSIIDAETDRMKIIMDDDRTRDIEEAQIRLKSAELQAKYGTQVNIAEINAIMERDREMIREAAKINAQGLFKNDGIVE
jgi:hypothetical protein